MGFTRISDSCKIDERSEWVLWRLRRHKIDEQSECVLQEYQILVKLMSGANGFCGDFVATKLNYVAPLTRYTNQTK